MISSLRKSRRLNSKITYLGTNRRSFFAVDAPPRSNPCRQPHPPVSDSARRCRLHGVNVESCNPQTHSSAKPEKHPDAAALGVLGFCGQVLFFCGWHCRLLSVGHAGGFGAVCFSRKQRAAQPPRESRSLPKTKSLTEKISNKNPPQKRRFDGCYCGCTITFL